MGGGGGGRASAAPPLDPPLGFYGKKVKDSFVYKFI